MYVVKKSEDNPILIPNINHHWEEFAAFNMCPIKKGKTVYGLYRAISAVDKIIEQQQTSIIGIGKSKDGLHFEDRVPFIEPKEEWDMNGCEDPRVTFFEGKYYIFYTALSGYPFNKDNIKVAVAVSQDLKKIDERHLVTPFNAKAMALFPERVNGKITVIFSAHTDMPPAKMAIAQVDRIEQLWDKSFWQDWEKNINLNAIDFRRNDRDHLEVGAPPIKTKYGWLLIYSHIQNYFPSTEEKLDRIFGIEALLIDFNDPKKIIGRTKGPILVPEESYELSGYVPNVIFPTGVIIDKDIVNIYYGAADTTTCLARMSLKDLISSMYEGTKDQWYFMRSLNNPIIEPIETNDWESKATFNPAAIYLNKKIHILYRTLSSDNTSFIGYASSSDGLTIDKRLPEPVYFPREDFERKKVPNGNSGCEDPRLTQIGKNIYICYTAYDSIGPPRVAVSSITEKDFLAHNWSWTKPILITPPGFDDKDTCIFPEKFKDGYLIIHRVGNEICGDYLSSLDFEKNIVKRCIRIIGPRMNAWDSLKVGIASPPVKTKYGWVLLYHGVSKSHSTYRVGVVLLDLKDPTIVLARSSDAIFEPEEDYEKFGIVNNVVFPCGVILKNDLLYIYYGGADKVTGVATMKLSVLISSLYRGSKFH
jgi:predicted GH43/DUF377 family glycosyl hydrolase